MSKTVKELAEEHAKRVKTKEGMKNVLRGISMIDKLVEKHAIDLARVATVAHTSIEEMSKAKDYDDIEAWTAVTAFIYAEGYMMAIKDGEAVSKDEDNS